MAGMANNRNYEKSGSPFLPVLATLSGMGKRLRGFEIVCPERSSRGNRTDKNFFGPAQSC